MYMFGYYSQVESTEMSIIMLYLYVTPLDQSSLSCIPCPICQLSGKKIPSIFHFSTETYA